MAEFSLCFQREKSDLVVRCPSRRTSPWPEPRATAPKSCTTTSTARMRCVVACAVLSLLLTFLLFFISQCTTAFIKINSQLLNRRNRGLDFVTNLDVSSTAVAGEGCRVESSGGFS